MIRVCAVLVVFQAAYVSAYTCDNSVRQVAKEGNVGETPVFPWLGVLRVHIHQGDTFKVALTGIVLVKERYAIANADDVARIPKRIFKEDSQAMFIPVQDKPWFCRLVDYMTHPEYEYATMNTIALVELDPGEERHFPMKPICWPPYSYNTSNELYAIGFTDDNKLLEKSVYSLQHVDLKLCEEFYNRAGLVEGKFTPTHYLCGFAMHNQDHCIWDNGMVLASNTTQQWKLIGFGIRGPGCAAPGRFIDMQPLFPWIESATNVEGNQMDFRKSAFNEGFRKQNEPNSSEETPDLTHMIQDPYPYDTSTVQNPYFTIDRIDDSAIEIRNISLPTNESCSGLDIVYNEETKVVYDGEGSISYRLSMYNLLYMNYSCVKISLRSTSCENVATVFYKVDIDNMEGTSFRDIGTTPEHLLQVYPITIVTPRPEPNVTTPVSAWKPGPHLKVTFIEDEAPAINIRNYNVYLTFKFALEGIIKLEVRGTKIPKPPIETTTEFLRDERRHLRAGDDLEYNDNEAEPHEHNTPDYERYKTAKVKRASVEVTKTSLDGNSESSETESESNVKTKTKTAMFEPLLKLSNRQVKGALVSVAVKVGTGVVTKVVVVLLLYIVK